MLINFHREDEQGGRVTALRNATARERKSFPLNSIRKYVGASYVKRQKLTMRLHMRRFTRLINVFSLRVLNFVRIHQTLRVTPAMAAGIADVV